MVQVIFSVMFIRENNPPPHHNNDVKNAPKAHACAGLKKQQAIGIIRAIDRWKAPYNSRDDDNTQL